MKYALPLFWGLAFLGVARLAISASPPNVIIVMTDDQGYGDFGCHGNSILKTPSLDRLASESLRLTNFHVCPMCTPTRGQLLSGQDALRNGAMNVSSGRTLLRPGVITLANAFQKAGYQCGQFGKWHLGDNYPYRPQDRGFHEAIYYPSSHIGSAADHWMNDYFDDTYWHNGTRQEYSGYTTDVFFGEAIRWMKSQVEQRKRFFCYIPTAAAHGPLFVPDKYRQLYCGQRRQLASFFGMVANIDENIGKLEQFLHDENIRDNTIVIFLTDNGGTVGVDTYNAGMRGRKIDLYEGGHRVPCFIRWPSGNLGASRDIGELTTVQDLFPTLVDLCGLDASLADRTDGINLAPLLRNMTPNLPDRKVVVQFSRMNSPRPTKGDACIMWKHWRLIGDKELYDVKADFAQTENVIERESAVVNEMRQHYDRWWQSVEPQLNEFSRIVLGNDAENPLLLSPCEWADVFLDQMQQVRKGERKNGTWHVHIARAGEYQFRLRRWPKEANTAISAPTPEYRVRDGNLIAGRALPITKARITIGSFDKSAPVSATDTEIVFQTLLPEGPAELKTSFIDNNNEALCGAYSVEVFRIP